MSSVRVRYRVSGQRALGTIAALPVDRNLGFDRVQQEGCRGDENGGREQFGFIWALMLEKYSVS
jgi:hypothetical protein